MHSSPPQEQPGQLLWMRLGFLLKKSLTGKFVRKVARSEVQKIGVADATAEKASLKQSQKRRQIQGRSI